MSHSKAGQVFGNIAIQFAGMRIGLRNLKRAVEKDAPKEQTLEMIGGLEAGFDMIMELSGMVKLKPMMVGIETCPHCQGTNISRSDQGPDYCNICKKFLQKTDQGRAYVKN